MLSLADTIGGNVPAYPSAGRRYRQAARFVLDHRQVSTRMDRNDRAKLLRQVELMERRTKAWGRRNGMVSRVAVDVLRVLVLRFLGPDGLCCPSIATLATEAGLCRASVCNALRRLEEIGVLVIVRRLTRVRLASGAVTCRQTSNLYAFKQLARLTPLPALPRAKPRAGFLAKLPGVYQMSAISKHQHKIEPPPLVGGGQDCFAGVVLPSRGPSDWRERARKTFSKR